MARKWSNLNLPGALHYVTGNFLDRAPVFTDPECCKLFLDELQTLNRNWPGKLITYVLLPSPPPHCQSAGWQDQGIHRTVEGGFREGNHAD